jgi:hypothetical protein
MHSTQPDSCRLKVKKMIARPPNSYFARLILSRLSESEIGKLDIMLDEDLRALLRALRGRQTVANNNSGCY